MTDTNAINKFAYPPHPTRSAVFDPELRPKGAHDEALPLSIDPEALDGEGGG